MFGVLDKKNVSERELSAARSFFSRLDVLPMDAGCGEMAAELLVKLRRRGAEIEETDCFIAASAISKTYKQFNSRFFRRECQSGQMGYLEVVVA